MRATLQYPGRRYDFFSLDQGSPKGDEVGRFLNQRKTAGHAKGFVALFKKIAQDGFGGIPAERAKSWQTDDGLFSEFKRPPWRIAYFVSGRRVLLACVFKKKGDTQPKEYRRAFSLYRRLLSIGW